MSIYQNINNKAMMLMSSYLDFCWIKRYLTIKFANTDGVPRYFKNFKKQYLKDIDELHHIWMTLALF